MGDEIGKTIKVDSTTRAKTIKVDSTTRAITKGWFARVCVEIDMGKLLRESYRMRGCFMCEKYGHCEVGCPLKTTVGNQ